MKAEDRGQLVRGKIAVGYWRTGCINMTANSFEEADKHNNVVAVTPWYRHDELEKCDTALKMLARCYSDMPGTEGMCIGYEYKDYKKLGK